jgi:hypothetical protein
MIRYFLTYRGVKLPLCMTEELPADALKHRNTYFRAEFNEQGLMLWVEKLVYGEVELRHDYRFDDQGRLLEAHIRMVDEEPHIMSFTGQMAD